MKEEEILTSTSMPSVMEIKADALYNANCIDFMKNMEDKSVDFTLTDIPYGNVNKNVNHEKCQGVLRQGESPLGQGWLSKKPF